MSEELFMKKYYILFFSLVFIGCTSTYKYNVNNPVDEKLASNKNVAITVSEDGFYGSNFYAGSGRTLSNVIKQEMKPYSSKVMILKNYETLDEIPETELERYDYFIIPAILHWEDRATSWSGIPDKVEVEIEIFNSKKELLKSAILSFFLLLKCNKRFYELTSKNKLH